MSSMVDCSPVIPIRLRGAGDRAIGKVRPTSLGKDTLGAVLHSLARKRFPKDTGLSLKETCSWVVGLKSGGRKGSKPGVRLAWASDCVSCWV